MMRIYITSLEVNTAMIKPRLNKYYHKKPINIYASDKQKKEMQ